MQGWNLCRTGGIWELWQQPEELPMGLNSWQVSAIVPIDLPQPCTAWCKMSVHFLMHLDWLVQGGSSWKRGSSEISRLCLFPLHFTPPAPSQLGIQIHNKSPFSRWGGETAPLDFVNSPLSLIVCNGSYVTSLPTSYREHCLERQGHSWGSSCIPVIPEWGHSQLA